MDAKQRMIDALAAHRADIESEIKGQVDELQAIDRLLAFYELDRVAKGGLSNAQADAALKDFRGYREEPAEPLEQRGMIYTEKVIDPGPEPEAQAVEPDEPVVVEAPKSQPPPPVTKPGFLPKPASAAATARERHLEDRCKRIARELASGRKLLAGLTKALGITWSEASYALKSRSSLGMGPEYFAVNGDGWELTPLGREKLLG